VDIGKDVIMAAFHRPKTAEPYDLMPPERDAGSRPRARFERKADVVDADFVIILPDRKTASQRTTSGHRRPSAETVQVRRPSALGGVAACVNYAEDWLQRASVRTFVLLIAALFVLVFGLAGGFVSLVDRHAAQQASLSFSHVTLTPRDANGMRVLVLNAIIDNSTGNAAAVPPIRADLVADDRLLASIVVSPPISELGVGESRGFSAKLHHPGGKMPEIRLSFVPSGASAPRV